MSLLLDSVISLVFSCLNLSSPLVLFPCVCIFAVVFFGFTFRLIRGDY